MALKSCRKNNGNALFSLLVWMLIGYAIFSYFSEEEIMVHASNLKDQIESFSAQKESTKTAFIEAANAQDAARKIQFRFKDSKTSTFVSRWESADEEVKDLRNQFDELSDSAEDFFDYIDDQIEDINDSSIKDRMLSATNARARSFGKSVSSADEAIDALEDTIQKGTDIIIALKISGALGALDEQMHELGVLSDIARVKFDEIDLLISEGTRLLDIEFR